MTEVSKAVASGAHRVDPHASSNADPHAQHHVSMSTYNVIIILLMLALIMTVIVAFIPLGEMNMIVAMAIAIGKALLVILFFMHVKYSSRLTKVFVVASFLWLSIMFALTFPDYISRGWGPGNSAGWENSPVKADYKAGTAAEEARGEMHSTEHEGTAIEKPAAAGEKKSG